MVTQEHRQSKGISHVSHVIDVSELVMGMGEQNAHDNLKQLSMHESRNDGTENLKALLKVIIDLITTLLPL